MTAFFRFPHTPHLAWLGKGTPRDDLVFDVYDKNARRFWSTARRNALVSRLGLHHIHQIGRGHYWLTALKQMLVTTASTYRVGSCEGIYLRQEDENWSIARAKLVHSDFVQGIGEHWRSRSLRWNALNGDQAPTP